MTPPVGNAPVQKLDRCIIDASVKFMGGMTVGTLASVIWFRSKYWPVLLCSGIGLGMAYNNCEITMNDLSTIRKQKHQSDKDTGEIKVAK